MVVDDAVVLRGMMARWIDAEADLQVVAALHSGREAIEHLDRAAPDVVLLDVDMPDIDGITALPLLLEKRRDLVVLMVSTLTRRNAEISLRALSIGAADYITKPETNRDLTDSLTFRRELIEKIRALGCAAGACPVAVSPAPPPRSRSSGIGCRFATASPSSSDAPGAAPNRRPASPVAAVLRCAAARAGDRLVDRRAAGAQRRDRRGIGPVIDQAPVLITQHMPPTFTAILAEHLARASSSSVPRGAARRADASRAHLCRSRRPAHAGGAAQRDAGSRSTTGHFVNFCKPAVDPLFSSAAAVWGGWSLALVLTGMGSDGAARRRRYRGGGRQRHRPGRGERAWCGACPARCANAGLCSAILPIDQIAPQHCAIVFRRPDMTPLDYDYLRKLLRERSGLVLSADKQYLVESRLLPVARSAPGLPVSPNSC